jgi:hypothetical protein
MLRFIRFGTICFLAAMAVNAVPGLWLAGHLETALPVGLTEPFYFAALYGFLLAWIYGFRKPRGFSLPRSGAGATPGRPRRHLSPRRAESPSRSVRTFRASVPFSAALALRDSGLVLAALSALVFLFGHGFLWRRAQMPALRTPGAPTAAIRAAFGCLALWALLEISAVVLSRATKLPAQNLWWSDAARHVFTIGFSTLLIVGMSFRILPVFSGKTLWSPRMAVATYALLLVGVGMRLLQYPAAFRPVFYEVGSFMGVPVVAALLLFVFNLIRTMNGEGERPQSSMAAAPAGFVSTLPVR